MDPLTAAAIAGGAIKGIGAVASFFSGRGSRKAQKKATEAYVKAIQAQPDLTPEDFVVNYQRLNPEDFTFTAPEEVSDKFTLGPSAIENIREDLALKEAKYNVLNRIQNQVDQGGLDTQDLAASNEIQRASDTKQRGNQEAITQSFQRRGLAGAGTELAARMAASGDAYSEASRQGEALAAQKAKSLDARLEALNRVSQGISNDAYGRDLTKAKAKDAVEEFNAKYLSGIDQLRVGGRNRFNADRDRVLNDIHVRNQGLTNRELDLVSGGRRAIKQQIGQKGVDAAGAVVGAADSGAKRAGVTAGAIGDVAGGVGDLVAIGGTAYANSQARKNNQVESERLGNMSDEELIREGRIARIKGSR